MKGSETLNQRNNKSNIPFLTIARILTLNIKRKRKKKKNMTLVNMSDQMHSVFLGFLPSIMRFIPPSIYVFSISNNKSNN